MDSDEARELGIKCVELDDSDSDDEFTPWAFMKPQASPAMPTPAWSQPQAMPTPAWSQSQVAQPAPIPYAAPVDTSRMSWKEWAEHKRSLDGGSASGTTFANTSSGGMASATVVHQASPTPAGGVTPSQRSTEPCINFLAGMCNFGDQCLFTHDLALLEELPELPSDSGVAATKVQNDAGIQKSATPVNFAASGSGGDDWKEKGWKDKNWSNDNKSWGGGNSWKEKGNSWEGNSKK